MSVLTIQGERREFLTVGEVAELLRCSEPIRRRIADGQLPAVRLGVRRSVLRVTRVAIETWLHPVHEEDPMARAEPPATFPATFAGQYPAPTADLTILTKLAGALARAAPLSLAA